MKEFPPARAKAGVTLVRVGAGGLTVKAAAGDAPLMLLTVMLGALTAVISQTGTTTFNCVELTKVVASLVVFHNIVEADVKFVPVMLSVKAAPPARAMDGLRLSRTGGGG